MLYRTNEVDGGLIIKAMNLDSWKVIIRELFLAHSMSARRNVINDISDVENTPLLGLALSLGLEKEPFLNIATSKLPETLRITGFLPDKEWTKSQIEKLGGEAIPWMKNIEAYEMPFVRGGVDDKSKRLFTLLHDSGRITRQEAASMLPIEILNPKSDSILIDFCASPGSKATQAAELLLPDGIVIGNEPVAGRVNLLVTNTARLGLHNVIICKHDGRSIGRIPKPGADYVVCDVPCSGTATTRKNGNVWFNWSPKKSRSMFDVQVGIAERAAMMLKPGGEMVYSTCSIDPCENEAVVAELLRRCPWMELEIINSESISDLNYRQGLSQWSILDEDGRAVADEQFPKLPLLKMEHVDPSKRLQYDSALDKEIEEKITSQLSKCMRIYHSDNNSGGFFVAKLTYRPDNREFARCYPEKSRVKPDGTFYEPNMRKAPHKSRHTLSLLDEETKQIIAQEHGIDANSISWFKRGKRIHVAPVSMVEKIHRPMTPDKRGNLYPEDTFHPLSVIQAGLPALSDNRGRWRVRQAGLPFFNGKTNAAGEISQEILIQLLSGHAPDLDSFIQDTGIPSEPLGTRLLKTSILGQDVLISAWFAAKVTLMIDEDGKDILRSKLNLPLSTDSNEEE